MPLVDSVEQVEENHISIVKESKYKITLKFVVPDTLYSRRVRKDYAKGQFHPETPSGHFFVGEEIVPESIGVKGDLQIKVSGVSTLRNIQMVELETTSSTILDRPNTPKKMKAINNILSILCDDGWEFPERDVKQHMTYFVVKNLK